MEAVCDVVGELQLVDLVITSQDVVNQAFNEVTIGAGVTATTSTTAIVIMRVVLVSVLEVSLAKLI